MDRPCRNNARLASALPAIALLSLLPSSGCGSSSAGIEGVACHSDGDCNAGLSCLPYYVLADGGGGNDAGCTPIGKQCLRPCHVDADCTEDPGLTCVTFCGGMAACEAASDIRAPEGGTPAAEGGGEAASD